MQKLNLTNFSVNKQEQPYNEEKQQFEEGTLCFKKVYLT